MATSGGPNQVVFVDRRQKNERRLDSAPSKQIPLAQLDKRKKTKDRRDLNRSLSDDYYAYMEKTLNEIYKSI